MVIRAHYALRPSMVNPYTDIMRQPKVCQIKCIYCFCMLQQRPGPTSGWSAYGRTSFKPESSRFYSSAPSFGQTPPYRPTAKPFQASVPPRFSPAPQTKQVPSQVLHQPPRMPAQDAISQNSLHEVSEIQEKFANKENLKPHMDSQNCLTKLNKGANTDDNFESKLTESAVRRDVAKMLDVVDIPAGHQRTQDPQVPSNSYLLKNTSIMQLV
jgi:hypothetical protein